MCIGATEVVCIGATEVMCIEATGPGDGGKGRKGKKGKERRKVCDTSHSLGFILDISPAVTPPPSPTLPLPGGPPSSPSVLNPTSSTTKATTPFVTVVPATALTSTQHTQCSGPLMTSTQAITSTSTAETPISVMTATCNALGSQVASTSIDPMLPMASMPVFPFTMALELSPAMSAAQPQAPSTAFAAALSNLTSTSKTAAPQPQCSPGSSMPEGVIDM
ncbi:hypothetical protein EDB83DRAFT_2316752 [Lactarius deliciosus]|nr:hypothetical protein EDB83DRAFT_2316752 [Lactarius deliciosus]